MSLQLAPVRRRRPQTLCPHHDAEDLGTAVGRHAGCGAREAARGRPGAHLRGLRGGAGAAAGAPGVPEAADKHECGGAVREMATGRGAIQLVLKL